MEVRFPDVAQAHICRDTWSTAGLDFFCFVLFSTARSMMCCSGANALPCFRAVNNNNGDNRVLLVLSCHELLSPSYSCHVNKLLSV